MPKTALSRRPARSGRALCLLAGLACAAIPMTARAAHPADRPMPYVEVTDHNAALLYYSAWMSMAPDLADALDDTGERYALAEGGREMLIGSHDTVDALLRASRQDHANWEIEYELGPNALLPYLGKLRYSTKILAADALWCAQDGDSSGAAERVAAMYRMSEHLSSDQILISSLVGLAISNFGNMIGAQLAEDGALTPEAAAELLDAMRGLDLSDPIGLRGAVIGERDIMGNYFIENFDGPDAGARVMGFAPEMLGESLDPSASPVGTMTGEELRRDIQGFRRYYDDVLVIWDQPDAAERISELSKGIETGEYGEFAKLFAASLSHAQRNRDKFRSDHAAAIAAMEKTANP